MLEESTVQRPLLHQQSYLSAASLIPILEPGIETILQLDVMQKSPTICTRMHMYVTTHTVSVPKQLHSPVCIMYIGT